MNENRQYIKAMFTEERGHTIIRNFVNLLLRNYAIVAISVGAGFVFGGVNEFRTLLLFELFITLLPVRLIITLMEKRFSNSNNIMLEHLLIFIIAMTFFLSGWRIFDWQQNVSIWFIIISVASVCVAAFLLDLRKTKKDIVYINEQLKQRRDKKKKRVK